MTPELFKAISGILAIFGLALCFSGYRLIRTFMALVGMLAGVAIGLMASRQLGFDTTITLIVTAAAGLLLGSLTGFLYLAGVFCAGGVALAGVGIVVLAHLGQPTSSGLVLGMFVFGGLIASFLERWLLVTLTAVVGALLVMVGMVPFVHVVPVPERLEIEWLHRVVAGLSPYWFLGAAALAVIGRSVQQRTGGGTVRGFATAHSRVTFPPPDDEPRPRPRAEPRRRRGDYVRSHESTCPRCGGVVDPNALFCPVCGNDQWNR